MGGGGAFHKKIQINNRSIRKKEAATQRRNGKAERGLLLTVFGLEVWNKLLIVVGNLS